MSHRIRVWDLPTRLFHWALAASVVALVVTAKLGGNAMIWHLRLGHVVLALLLFRIVWGFWGGHWSRFASFLHSPRALVDFLRGRGTDAMGVGHSPTGALSVFALLAILAIQVATGLASDDEIAFSGPLTRFLPGALVSQATGYHKGWGQWLVIGLALLHVAAVLFYLLGRRQNLIGPMVHGDKTLEAPQLASRDDPSRRLRALMVAAVCAAASYGIMRLSQ